jgi:type IV pilus assembly protein PilO
MDFKDPKNQILVLIVIVFVALTYIWYQKFYTPYAAELTAKKARLEQILTNLHAVQQKAASLQSLQQDYEALAKRYETVRLLLPEQKEDETLLSQVHIAAQITNSAVVSVIPQPSTPKDFFISNNYLVELSCTYHGLGEFFARVANFPFIVTVSDVQMTALDQNIVAQSKSLRKKDHTLTASFKLTTYNVRDGGLAGGGQAQ